MLSKYCPACHNFLHKQGPRPGVIGTLLYYIRWTFSWLMFSELLKQLKWNIANPQPCPHFHWPAHLAEVRLHPGGFLILRVSHMPPLIWHIWPELFFFVVGHTIRKVKVNVSHLKMYSWEKSNKCSVITHPPYMHRCKRLEDTFEEEKNNGKSQTFELQILHVEKKW